MNYSEYDDCAPTSPHEDGFLKTLEDTKRFAESQDSAEVIYAVQTLSRQLREITKIYNKRLYGDSDAERTSIVSLEVFDDESVSLEFVPPGETLAFSNIYELITLIYDHADI